jgi:hypothetical protein
VIVFVGLGQSCEGRGAGQGVQNMNLIFCIEKSTGLVLSGSNPYAVNSLALLARSSCSVLRGNQIDPKDATEQLISG